MDISNTSADNPVKGYRPSSNTRRIKRQASRKMLESVMTDTLQPDCWWRESGRAVVPVPVQAGIDHYLFYLMYQLEKHLDKQTSRQKHMSAEDYNLTIKPMVDHYRHALKWLRGRIVQGCSSLDWDIHSKVCSVDSAYHQQIVTMHSDEE